MNSQTSNNSAIAPIVLIAVVITGIIAYMVLENKMSSSLANVGGGEVQASKSQLSVMEIADMLKQRVSDTD